MIITDPQWYQIALYVVDWDAQNRDMVIEISDYESKEIVSFHNSAVTADRYHHDSSAGF